MNKTELRSIYNKGKMALLFWLNLLIGIAVAVLAMYNMTSPIV